VKNDSNKLIIHLTLPEDFMTRLADTIEDELAVASKKWKVELNEDSRDIIRRHSRAQLRQKTAETSRSPWDLSSRVTVKVNATGTFAGKELELPVGLTAAAADLRLIRMRDGWEIDTEARDGSVALSEFSSFFQEKLLTWVRTAVFYGVGTYAQ
jgi:hypothetical protein